MRYGLKWSEYAKQWDRMKINPSRVKTLEGIANFAINHRDIYEKIEQRTGVPWPLIAALHRRESDADFSTYLGNGEPLSRVTKLVPKGRGPFKSFADGAVDALRLDGLTSVSDWRLEKQLFFAEQYNGTGYNNRGLPSPYLWGLTNVQQRGKFTSDNRFNRNAMDTQPGVAAILAMIAELDPSVQFVRED